MRILIIGKNSFIGRNFIQFSKFENITEVDSINLVPNEFDYSNYDVIIHLAAIVHQTKKIGIDEYIKVNTELPVRVAKKAKQDGVKQFIFLSTTKVYGDISSLDKPWTEETTCNPTDAYGKSKFLAEQELLKLTDDSFIVSIIRTPLVYGKGVKANMLGLIKLVKLFPILPFKNVKSYRSVTYVGNLSALIDRIIDARRNGVFLSQDSEPVSIGELVTSIADALQKKVILFNPGVLILKMVKFIFPFIYKRLYESAVVNNELTRRSLGFTPPYSAKQGINETVSWFLNDYK
ncbi:NAD-dependent epimerase/dehydratase family protein [Tenuifilum thalassicum]|uniref:NAD-dependent epimerase/dehydratase family protein n=1 Tax=Tenuifilum thalassicum TaxID=2590900 RepID=A0A7D4C9D9_9BACT|nr:NAD-dependent epimerase/dehydratase family protein [Tenuifilum thalassicum]QKG80222.1 NAD-dependent epimerase/dehydratase family protein [Tenuifilum thalassicum]